MLSPDKAPSHGSTRGPKRGAHPSENDEEIENLQDQETISRALEGFERRMLDTLHEKSDIEIRRKLLCIWHEVTIYMLCHRLATPEECPVFLRRWLGYVQQFTIARSQPEALGRFFFTSVAILAFNAMQEESKRSLQHLHETLEGFCHRQITAEYGESAIDIRWEHGIARAILGIEAPNLDSYLRAVLETKTSLDEIGAFLTSVQSGDPVDFSSGVFTSSSHYGKDMSNDLRSVIANGDPSRYLVLRRDDRHDSSCCHLYFAENARATYMAIRVAKCPQCRKFNLRLQP